MRAVSSMRQPRAHLPLVGALVAALIMAWPLPAAQAADPRLEKAQAERVAVQTRLDGLYQRLSALEAEAGALEAELARLRAEEEAHEQQAASATSALAERVRESYIRGTADPSFALLSSGSVDEAREQARLLGVLALRSRGDYESASAARTRTDVAAGEVEHAAEALRARQAEVDAVRAEVAELLAKAQAEEQHVRDQIAAEQAERERKERERQERERQVRERQERERAARSRPAANSAGSATAQAAPAAAPAAPAGGVACPVGQPRSYSDTWGAPRSGGRRHKGTDILAPRGTPIYAYEAGTITRLNNNRLGGISLYLRGASGTLYYYTHLQGYVSGLSSGQSVSAGQHIASNGDTGNARGIPHLHFEVMPGGGANVNPYPYVRRACG